MTLTVVLPCYNEEENIKRIPGELMPVLNNLGLKYDILIIDDGSADNTYESAKNLNIPEIKILKHPKNLGVGAAFKTAIENIDGDICVFLDADFTFHPRYIKDLLERFGAGDVDCVGGTPWLDKEYSHKVQWWRKIISKGANAVYALLLKQKITASTPFFRLYKTADLKELQLDADGFSVSAEILFKLLLSGKRYAEVPTPLAVRKFGQSKLNYRKEVFRHTRLLFKIFYWRIKFAAKG